tara:strand:+ start:330 stop:1682 length:1353 start_codon:yes stop_codon:yes gene_type:complete
MYLFLFLFHGLLIAQDAKARFEMMNTIRRDKLDLVLPGAMRDNDIDVWIHVIRRGDPDPMELDFGVNMGHVVFTDYGGDRIERALFGNRFAEIADESVYDIFGDEEDIKDYIKKKDPKTIAVNMSDWITVGDGLSHTDYLNLTSMLGKKYSKRLVSSENVITDFQVRRVQSEIIAFANICENQRRVMENALKMIKPGVTTREEIGWLAQDQLSNYGIYPSLFGAPMPGILYFGSKTKTGVVHREDSGPEYRFQRGDFISWDLGVKYMNYGTDYKRNAYILKENETHLPDGLIHAWDRGIKARKIIRKNIKIGNTARKTLSMCAKALEKSGYVYTPFTDFFEKDKKLIESLGNSEKSGFSIDCHTVGNTGNSEISVGPSFAPFRDVSKNGYSGRGHLVIQENNLFAFEYMIHTWIPEWNRRVSINFEDNAIVTSKGVEFLYPVNEKIIVIP